MHFSERGLVYVLKSWHSLVTDVTVVMVVMVVIKRRIKEGKSF